MYITAAIVPYARPSVHPVGFLALGRPARAGEEEEEAGTNPTICGGGGDGDGVRVHIAELLKVLANKMEHKRALKNALKSSFTRVFEAFTFLFVVFSLKCSIGHVTVSRPVSYGCPEAARQGDLAASSMLLTQSNFQTQPAG